MLSSRLTTLITPHHLFINCKTICRETKERSETFETEKFEYIQQLQSALLSYIVNDKNKKMPPFIANQFLAITEWYT